MGIFDELKQTAENALNQELQQVEQQGIQAVEEKLNVGNLGALLGGAHPTAAVTTPADATTDTDTDSTTDDNTTTN